MATINLLMFQTALSCSAACIVSEGVDLVPQTKTESSCLYRLMKRMKLGETNFGETCLEIESEWTNSTSQVCNAIRVEGVRATSDQHAWLYKIYNRGQQKGVLEDGLVDQSPLLRTCTSDRRRWYCPRNISLTIIFLLPILFILNTNLKWTFGPKSKPFLNFAEATSGCPQPLKFTEIDAQSLREGHRKDGFLHHKDHSLQKNALDHECKRPGEIQISSETSKFTKGVVEQFGKQSRIVPSSGAVNKELAVLVQKFGYLDREAKLEMLLMCDRKARKQENRHFGLQLKRSLKEFMHVRIREKSTYKKLCSKVVDLVPEDRWMRFVRLYLNLDEDEIKKFRRQHATLSSLQKLQFEPKC